MIDASHPFYIHPSDSPGMVLVSSIFYGKSYGGWRREIVIALSAKKKIGFIDGSIIEPDMDSPSLKSWNRCNDMVISWILNSLSKEIAWSVLYSKTTKQILTTCVHCNCDCSCGGKAKTLKSLQDGRLIQFLKGPNETYDPVKRNILMMTLLPSVNHAYFLLIQNEKQREIHVGVHPC
ncbi:uncharacterized protein LOC142178841 [Nicotiana tabacum]|uniref:Uncharacterized protein LOC142178841 n=1 Tax=Nicotiana tabacum TaxID=4097 RepID=A0AC58U5E3_TOBAC